MTKLDYSWQLGKDQRERERDEGREERQLFFWHPSLSWGLRQTNSFPVS